MREETWRRPPQRRENRSTWLAPGEAADGGRVDAVPARGAQGHRPRGRGGRRHSPPPARRHRCPGPSGGQGAPVRPGRGGALLDSGACGLSLAELLFGPPATVSARSSLSGEGVDETTTVLLGHARGAVVEISCSMTTHLRTGAVLEGSEGRIKLPSPSTGRTASSCAV
ncbi:Gfo/Idh/MocA family protein [Streptomyces sudanensis]|uniref:Gfo/Idh/MocA family protein n=1 Tax=Streptomyces sudanensis TaxID=436397 RepID=UPI003558D123